MTLSFPERHDTRVIGDDSGNTLPDTSWQVVDAESIAAANKAGFRPGRPAHVQRAAVFLRKTGGHPPWNGERHPPLRPSAEGGIGW